MGLAFAKYHFDEDRTFLRLAPVYPLLTDIVLLRESHTLLQTLRPHFGNKNLCFSDMLQIFTLSNISSKIFHIRPISYQQG